MSNKIWEAFGGGPVARAGAPVPSPSPGPAPTAPDVEVHPERLRPVAEHADALFARLQTGSGEVSERTRAAQKQLEAWPGAAVVGSALEAWERNLSALRNDLGQSAENIRQTVNAYVAHEQAVAGGLGGGN
ncbi:type VII secretion target [Kitasatospora sp. NPDC048538]|uniref:WXG100 family type VII secretion target n=1 Tax=unclassified Kitasatospora TaxID=2633591 RepID=UPI0033D9E595